MMTLPIKIMRPRYGTALQMHNMDLTAYSSVGTQTPTEDRSFEFPECFSSSSQLSRSSTSSSSIGTQTSVRQRVVCEESPELPPLVVGSGARPRLFRRHSTGSDVYNFSSSPTLMTAFGGSPFGQRGVFSQRLIAEDSSSTRTPLSSVGSSEDVEQQLNVGQQLRQIADDIDRGLNFRSRSLSVVRRKSTASSVPKTLITKL